MPSELDQKIEEKGSELRELVDKNENLVNKDGDLTKEEQRKFDERAEKIDDLQDDLERYKRQKKQKQFNQARRNEPVREEPSSPADDTSSDDDLVRSEEYKHSFEKYCRYGRDGMSSDERSVLQEGFELRAQSSGTDDLGGYTVPQDMAEEIEAAQLQFGRVTDANVTEIETDGGGDLLIPTSDDTGNKGQIVGENASISTTDISFSQKRLGAYLYSSDFVKVSLSLMQDTGFDMESFIGSRLGERLGRIQAEHWTTGDGSNEPEGFVTGALNQSATVSAASSSSIDENDLIDLKHGVDPAYRPGEWMMHDDITKEILKITDSNNNHPFVESFRTTDGIMQLLGNEAHQNQEMDSSISSNNETLAYGDFSKYHIRTVQGFELRRVEERFIDNGQVAFLAFQRADGALLDAGTNPIKVLQH